jgi:ubiquinone/menaquinone biosynthesis C-methylase UbiE
VSADHEGAIQRAFSQQAPSFEDPRYAPIFTAQTKWMFARLVLRTTDVLLDVAAGTGHVARALAPSVRCAVALDATEAMLRQGKAAADRDGLRNVIFLRADATALPFPDASFDVIVARYAVHHFASPEGPLAEMIRCLRPGGRIAVADIVADPDPTVAAAQNHLERLRDPSHTGMLALEDLAALLQAAGLTIVSAETRDVERALAAWLDQADALAATRAAIGAELAAELAGGPPTGFRPREVEGEMRFLHRIASVVAARGNGDPATDAAGAGAA